MADINEDIKVIPTFEDTEGLNARWVCYLYNVSPGTNFFDEPITTELKLRGGAYESLEPTVGSNVNIGDYLEFSVIDKDDILGYFQYYGLTVGVDVLELKKFVVKEYLNPYSNLSKEFKTQGAFDIIPGLYFRTTVYNGGTSNFNLKVESYHYE